MGHCPQLVEKVLFSARSAPFPSKGEGGEVGRVRDCDCIGGSAPKPPPNNQKPV